MTFAELAQRFFVIEQESSRLTITTLLGDLFANLTPEEARVVSYLALGTIRPVFLGTQFNFGAKGMEYVAARLLKCSIDAVMERMSALGDWGDVIAEGDWEGDQSATILSVYEDLERFESISGTGSFDEKIIFFVALLRSVNSRAARYIVRIVMQNLRLGFSDMTLLDGFSWMLQGDKKAKPAIERAYNVSADIGKIAFLVVDGGLPALREIEIEVGVPIRPAAAERMMTAEDIIAKIGPCFAQPKYDGFRLQVHVKTDEFGNKKVSFFSRNLLDMSHMFPDLSEAVRCLPCKSIICEGEALAFDEVSGSYLPFQETVKRRRKHKIDSFAQDMPLRLVLFDILYQDGRSYISQELRLRYELLQRSIIFCENSVLQVAEQVECDTAEALESYFLSCVGDGLEGIMAKRQDGVYQPGKRNFNWIKLKRIERGVLDDTIDVVVLGYYQGEGRRSAFGIGALLVGVYNKEHDKFESIAKIGTGLSDIEWVSIREQCDQEKIAEKPVDVLVAKNLWPDVWVAPRMVVVVRADEITKSPIHTAGSSKNTSGFALRFPRFISLRNDKSAVDATTVREIRTMFEQQKRFTA